MHLLMYFTHWINVYLDQPRPRNTHINETHARWIFALLSRVEDYVSADEMSLLRNLARACIALMKDEFQDPPPETGSDTRMSRCSCWLIIAAVVGHWAQKDLWMDVETMLAEVDPS